MAEPREQVSSTLERLAKGPTSDDLSRAKALARALRDARDYESMGRLVEAIGRREPDDAATRALYGQYLIDTGKVTAAIDVLMFVHQRLRKSDPDYAEVAGLIGRAYKQIFIDFEDKQDAAARHALKHAIAFYREPFEENPRQNTWHGVNLAALAARARHLELPLADGLDPKEIAARVVRELDSLREDERNEWFLPTLAEALLGIGDWARMEQTIRRYAAVSIPTPAFLLSSTLRQFTQIWDLERSDERGPALVEILRARLALTPGGVVELTAEQLQTLQDQKDPDERQLEAVLGPDGVATYEWWETGRDRALSVASIRTGEGQRIATGFLVEAGDFGLYPPEERVLLTNYHVVNQTGGGIALTPRNAVVVFEAAARKKPYHIDKVLWSSALLDASILRLRPVVTDLIPLPISFELPDLVPHPRKVHVYAIGHPAGRELCFSFRGNHLIDHEGPPRGNPPVVERRRVHYTATTEPGSSGSPIFNATLWEVIALHSAGQVKLREKLNQKPGVYSANEGIAMQSIKDASTAAAQRQSAGDSTPASSTAAINLASSAAEPPSA